VIRNYKLDFRRRIDNVLPIGKRRAKNGEQVVDQVTRRLLEDFVLAEGLQHLEQPAAFERFVNYCVVSKEFSGSFNVEDISCGAGDDAGLDGVAIIVNGSVVTSDEEVVDLYDTNGFLEVVFIFTQAKTGSTFDGGEIGTFLAGVKDFFAEHPRLRRNEFVESAAALQRAIYERSASFRGNPSCRMYYATTGTWQNDETLLGRVADTKTEIEVLALFSSVDFIPLDARSVQDLYRSTKNRVSSEFRFDSKTVLPEMDGIAEAYLGVLPVSEFLKLIEDPDSRVIRKSLFYDNVRDFQGDNEVNLEIEQTLEGARRTQFAVLNNGVTVVAKTLRVTGNRFHIEDYQIVNGCQTSHVIYEHRDSPERTSLSQSR
jgi:hypothetical protein